MDTRAQKPQQIIYFCECNDSYKFIPGSSSPSFDHFFLFKNMLASIPVLIKFCNDAISNHYLKCIKQRWINVQRCYKFFGSSNVLNIASTS